jgi:hypothetical protein
MLMSLFISTEALSRLYNVIKHPNALDLDNAMAYDNAVSALGKICQFHRDSIDASQVSYAFMHHMFLFESYGSSITFTATSPLHLSLITL